MFRRLTTKEIKKIKNFIEIYKRESLGTSPSIFYGSSAELVGQKLVMASAYMLYAELGVLSGEKLCLSHLNSDTENLVEKVAIGIFEDCSYDSSFIPAFNAVGWESVEAKGVVPQLLDLEIATKDYYCDGAEVYYVCFQNDSWANFFKAIRENGLEKNSLYKKILNYMPCDFLHYFFCGDIDYVQPTHGYYCHMMGYDGGDCDLNMLALDITFPMKCLVCESYMHKMMDKYPKLKEVVCI